MAELKKRLEYAAINIQSDEATKSLYVYTYLQLLIYSRIRSMKNLYQVLMAVGVTGKETILSK